jgi:hypothetical protein
MRIPLRDELRAFWPRYLAHHTHPANRALHYAADCALAIGLVASIACWRPLPAAAGALCAVALVVAGHVLVERNAPLVFRHPLLASLCNVRMAWLALTTDATLVGRMGQTWAPHDAWRSGEGTPSTSSAPASPSGR